MAQGVLNGVSIRGVVACVPGEAQSIESLPSRFTVEERGKMAATVGLATVHRTNKLTATDLCIAAAKRLLEKLAWDASSIDAVFLVTQTPDHFLPASACVAHRELKLSTQCLAFDIGMGCSGYVYGLWVASQFAVGGAKRVLLLAGDTISNIISSDDNSVSLLFGDAGTATAVEIDADSKKLSFVGGTDGQGTQNLIVPAGGFRQRSASAAQGAVDEFLFMDGLEIFQFAMKRVPPAITQVMELQGWKEGDCDLFLLHQANQFMLQSVARKMKLNMAKVPLNISKFGNTSMASIPLLIADNAEIFAKSHRVVMAGFGVGYSWAAAALELGPLACAEIVTAEEPRAN